MRPLRIFLLAMLAGCLTYIAQYESWFALKGYKVEAQSQELEKRLWEIFPQRCLTFWPYLLKDSKGMKEFFERDMPVTVETHMYSLGRFTTKIEWLNSWIKIEWLGKIWSISQDGRMWLTENGKKNDESTVKLVWKIPEQGNLRDDINAQVPMIGVFKSPLDTRIISSFIEEYKNYKWFELINEISWQSRAGMDLFILKMKKDTQNFELHFQPGKYPGQDVGENIENLISDLISKGGSHIIDATYEGKIFLRSL